MKHVRPHEAFSNSESPPRTIRQDLEDRPQGVSCGCGAAVVVSESLLVFACEGCLGTVLRRLCTIFRFRARVGLPKRRLPAFGALAALSHCNHGSLVVRSEILVLVACTPACAARAISALFFALGVFVLLLVASTTSGSLACR